MPAPSTLSLYRQFEKWPGGRQLFSRLLCLKAPYFRTISPRVEVLEPGRSVWHMRKRRGVQNHIGTVHALAMGNLCEMAAGTLMEASLPAHKRWIPKGMNIEYLAKAETDLSAEAILENAEDALGDVPVEVTVRDREGKEVVKATINMYVSERKKG